MLKVKEKYCVAILHIFAIKQECYIYQYIRHLFKKSGMLQDKHKHEKCTSYRRIRKIFKD